MPVVEEEEQNPLLGGPFTFTVRERVCMCVCVCWGGKRRRMSRRDRRDMRRDARNIKKEGVFEEAGRREEEVEEEE